MVMAGRDVPDYSVSLEYRYISDMFWELKSLCGDIGDPISPGLMRDYFELQGRFTSSWERSVIFSTDMAFRSKLSQIRQRNDKIISSR